MAKFKSIRTADFCEAGRKPMRITNGAELLALEALSRCSLPAGSAIASFVRQKMHLRNTGFLITDAQSQFLWVHFWHYRRQCVERHQDSMPSGMGGEVVPSFELRAVLNVAAEFAGQPLAPLAALIEECSFQDASANGCQSNF